MAEENKRVSYSQFKECVCKELKMYFAEAEFRKKNYEVAIMEDKDAYDAVEELVYLSDIREPAKKVPAYSLTVAYETYCRSGDLNGVMAALATAMEKQYPMEQKQQIIEEEFVKSVVTEIEGYPEENIRSVYLITDQNEKRSSAELLKEDETLASIAEKEKDNLQIIVVADKAVLAIPASSETEVLENRDILSELWKMAKQEVECDSLLYDRDRNLLLSDAEEIKELLAKKQKKKNVFSK